MYNSFEIRPAQRLNRADHSSKKYFTYFNYLHFLTIDP